MSPLYSCCLNASPIAHMQQPRTLCGNFEAKSPLAQARSASCAFAGAPNRARALPMSQASDTVDLGTVRFGNRLPLALIAGPCAMESRAHALEMAAALKEIAERLGIGLVYKSSFDKANRTSAGSARGIGIERGAADLRRGEGALRPAGDDRRARDRALRRRRGGRRHPADPGLPVPADRPPRRRRQDRPGGERQEGPVPRPLGHGERGARRSPTPAIPRSW